MALPKIYNQSRRVVHGFTLMEVLVVLAMLAIIASATLFFSMSFYQRELLVSERSILVSILQTARAQAMQNMGGVPHGVAISPENAHEYVVFSGESYVKADEPLSVVVPYAAGIKFASNTPSEIVFSQLSGQSSYEGVITIYEVARPYSSTTITINYEGAIY